MLPKVFSRCFTDTKQMRVIKHKTFESKSKFFSFDEKIEGVSVCDGGSVQ